jgi:hypothetical protein
MRDKPLFEGMDEQERDLAPQQLPEGQRRRVAADERAVGADETDPLDVPKPIPLGNVDITPSGVTIVPDPDADADLRETRQGNDPDV